VIARIRVIGMVLTLVASGGWLAVTRGNRPARIGNVLIITLDTTRADRLTPYGYMSASMPHLEWLAREGVVFDQAISVAPLTLPAHCSLFTGLYPARHGVRHNASAPLPASAATLAEALQQEGFRTAGFVASIVLDPDRGLAQGFQTYAGVGDGGQTPTFGQRRADAVVDEAIRWLDSHTERFLLWTHFYDPHRPYEPPRTFGSVSDPYVGEIAFVDSQIGRLIGALERRGVLEETLVVVVGDHGESLGEHGERDHGIFLYESVLRVPLIIRASSYRAGRVGGVVRLIDVMPTVLDYLGIAGPPMDGLTLTPLLAGGPPLDLEAYAESFDLRDGAAVQRRVLREARYKVIDGPRPELYDVIRDPFELRNLSSERQPLARLMLRRLQRHGAEPLSTSERAVPADVRARVAALGYSAPRVP
jgi:choline-sulfatase